MRRLSLAAVLLWVPVLMVCSDLSPISPTASFKPEGTEESVLLGSIGQTADDDFTVQFQEGSGVMTATIYNPKKGPRYVGLACYQGQVYDIEGQVLNSPNHAHIAIADPGKSVVITVGLPCGYFQCDAFFDFTEVPEKPNFGSKLIGAKVGFYDCPVPPPPPPPGCEEINAKLSCDETVGEESVYGVCTWFANADLCLVYEDGELRFESCSGFAEFSYQRGESSSEHKWNIVAEKGEGVCDPSDTILVPPYNNSCAESYLSVECEVNGSLLQCDVSSSTVGSLSALGVSESFSAGNTAIEIPIPEPVCGRRIEVSVSNSCQQGDNLVVETEECPACEPTPYPEAMPLKEDDKIGNPKKECALFGLVPIGKDDYGDDGPLHTVTMSAPIAIGVDGKYEGKFWYYWYENVVSEQVLRFAPDDKDVSHVTYCGCVQN